MNEYLLEPFLTQYFLLDAICGHFLTEEQSKNFFHDLAELFCLPAGGEQEAYLAEAMQPHFRDIRTNAAYERLCRIIEFGRAGGQDPCLTERDKVILAQKREAMAIRHAIFGQAGNLTKESAASALTMMALNGNVDAMAALSYLEYHGICLEKDPEGAVRRIRVCARWNHLFGNLMGIAYDPQTRPDCLRRLHTVLRSEEQKRGFEQIHGKWGSGSAYQKDGVARLLEKAFGQGIIRRNGYDDQFAKVAFSELLCLEDKKKLLLHKQKEALVGLTDLPLDVKKGKTLAFDPSCGDKVVLRRDQELRQILQNIAVAQCCAPEAYAPLLVVASDGYLTEMYSNMLRAGFPENAVVEIDAGTLTEADFVGGRENIFLRGMMETRSARTVFLVKDCHELEKPQLDELCKLLDGDYRRKYKLFQPPVSLDLSGLVFVLLAQERNAAVQQLAQLCDTVWTERIGQQEKAAVVEAVFRSRAKSFGMEDMTLETGCREFLGSFDTKHIQQMLDTALRRAVFEGHGPITLAQLKESSREQSLAAPRRGFGYMGGNRNAAN